MVEREAWETELSFWIDDEIAYRERLDPEALMVFPPPAGIMDADAIRSALRGAPRWRQAKFSETKMTRPSKQQLLLAYHADAQREDGTSYRAYCGSVYRCDGERWLLVFHQQTPAGDN